MLANGSAKSYGVYIAHTLGKPDGDIVLDSLTYAK